MVFTAKANISPGKSLSLGTYYTSITSKHNLTLCDIFKSNDILAPFAYGIDIPKS
jgi:hypothetical protein